MNHRVLTLVAASALCAGVSLAPATAFAQAPGASSAVRPATADNDQLEDAIEKKWEADTGLRDADIDVSVNAGVATLTGEVGTAALKSRAARLANVTGITRVDNQITVQRERSVADKTRTGTEKAVNKSAEAVGTAAGATKRGVEVAADGTKKGVGVAARETEKGVGVAAKETKNAARKTGKVASDTWLTTKVKTKITSERGVLKGSAITVHTKEGVVTLTGTVLTEEGRAKANEIAKTTDGVKSVVDNLVIGPKTN